VPRQDHLFRPKPPSASGSVLPSIGQSRRQLLLHIFLVIISALLVSRFHPMQVRSSPVKCSCMFSEPHDMCNPVIFKYLKTSAPYHFSSVNNSVECSHAFKYPAPSSWNEASNRHRFLGHRHHLLTGAVT
jgi:hypothetical protein